MTNDIMTQIFEVLNNDPKANELMTNFNNAAKSSGITEAEYMRARETVLMMAIYQNKEAMQIMSDNCWNALNGAE